MKIVGYLAVIAGGAVTWSIQVFVGLAVAATLGGYAPPVPEPGSTSSTSPTASPAVTVAVPDPGVGARTPPVVPRRSPSPRRVAPTPAKTSKRVDEPRSAYYASCAAAERAGAAPLVRGEPGYRRGLDRDGDGVACE